VISELVQDLRYGARSLVKARGFAAIAILTLALGIGANSAIFSFVDGVLLKPLPYRDPERILNLWEKPPGGGNNVVSAMNFLDWRAQSTVFETVVAATGGAMTLSGRGDPALLRVGRVSTGYFDIYGIKPALGRTFQPGEDEFGKHYVIVLSHASGRPSSAATRRSSARRSSSTTSRTPSSASCPPGRRSIAASTECGGRWRFDRASAREIITGCRCWHD
jgi:hypothetical protein